MPKRSFDMLVGTAPARILPANPKRKSYAIVNNGSAIIYLGGDAGVTVESGEPLLPGEMVSDDTDDEDVWAISVSADQDVRVTEIIKRE